MQENETDSNASGQIHCSSCGGVIPPEDVTEGKAKQAGRQIFCTTCADVKEKVEAIKCRHCGNHEPPLFDGRNYLCRKCGGILKQEKRVALVGEGSAKVPVQLCPYCRAVVGLGARKCRACGARLDGAPRAARPVSAVKGYLIGSAATCLIIITVMLAYQKINASRPLPLEQPKPVDTQAIKQEVMSTVEGTLGNYKKEMIDDVVKAINVGTEPMRRRLDNLEKAMAAKPAPAQTDVKDTAPDDQTSVAKIIQELKAAGKDPEKTPAAPEKVNKTPVVKPPDETPAIIEAPPDEVKVDAAPPLEEKQPDVKTDETPAPAKEPVIVDTEAPDKTPVEPAVAEREDLNQVAAKLKDTAKKLADDNKFADALALLDSRPDIRDPIWQADREKAKIDIRKRADELFRMDIARAEGMVRGGRYADARDLYRQIAAYGLPEMAKEANKCLDEIKTVKDDTPEAKPPVAAANEDPRVAKYLMELRDKEAAEYVRSRAVKALGELKAASAVDDLLLTMDDRNWFLRVCAAGSLAQLADIRAVPALIRNLQHPMIPVREAAREALAKITGKDFDKDVDKWREWWKNEGGRALPPAVLKKLQEGSPDAIGAPKEPQSFESQIVIYKEAEKTLTFIVKANAALKTGQKLNILREGKPLCSVEVTVTGFGHATGKITDLPEGTTVKVGDIVTVNKEQAEETP